MIDVRQAVGEPKPERAFMNEESEEAEARSAAGRG